MKCLLYNKTVYHDVHLIISHNASCVYHGFNFNLQNKKQLQRCLILLGLFHFLVVCDWLAFLCFGDLIGSSSSCEGRHDVVGFPRRRRVQSDRAFKAVRVEVSPADKWVQVSRNGVKRHVQRTDFHSAIDKLGRYHSDTAQICVLFGIA